MQVTLPLQTIFGQVPISMGINSANFTSSLMIKNLPFDRVSGNCRG
jgi:hypothetical protein